MNAIHLNIPGDSIFSKVKRFSFAERVVGLFRNFSILDFITKKLNSYTTKQLAKMKNDLVLFNQNAELIDQQISELSDIREINKSIQSFENLKDALITSLEIFKSIDVADSGVIESVEKGLRNASTLQSELEMRKFNLLNDESEKEINHMVPDYVIHDMNYWGELNNKENAAV